MHTPWNIYTADTGLLHDLFQVMCYRYKQVASASPAPVERTNVAGSQPPVLRDCACLCIQSRTPKSAANHARSPFLSTESLRLGCKGRACSPRKPSPYGSAITEIQVRNRQGRDVHRCFCRGVATNGLHNRVVSGRSCATTHYPLRACPTCYSLHAHRVLIW